jgi:hypothetical protein
MNTGQSRNVEQAIDDLCKNLVWSWAYFMTLQALHEVAKSSPSSLDRYPQFISCLYHGLFDCLFIKMHNFFDRSKGACGFPHLFTILRRYSADDSQLMAQIGTDEARFRNEVNIEKIKIWRNEISAHLTEDYRHFDSLSSNHLHLSELENLLNLIEEKVENYSSKILGRFNDTRHPSNEIIKEIEALFLPRPE